MPKEEYVSNDSFMTSQVKVPKAFGGDYEDPLEALKKSIAAKQKPAQPTIENIEDDATHPPTNAPTGIPTHPPTNLPTHQRTHPPIPKVEYPISADRDFSKMPNSIKRALEQGWFINSSFQVYYYLFNLTRTAIKARRIVQVPKAQLLIGSGLKADKALLENIAYLESIGLITKTVRSGDKKGNLYEVFRPEEVPLGDTPPTHLPTYPPTNIPTNVGHSSTHVPTQLNDVGGWVQTVENESGYSAPKTSFKDNKNDDEAFAGFIEIFQNWSRTNHGKDLPLREKDKWTEFAKFFTAVLDRAQTSISSVPAFLLSDVVKNYAEAAAKIKKGTLAVKDTVGKSPTDIEEFPTPKDASEINLEDMDGIEI